MILACSANTGHVEWAKEAVRVVIGEIQAEGRQPGPAENKLLSHCRQKVKNAEADFAEMGYYEVAEVEKTR